MILLRLCGAVLIIGNTVILGLTSSIAAAQDQPTPSISELQVVDCLLPGQVRRLGQMRYITARRPILTTGADCRLRGGEYTEYDRADYRSALAVWMPAAEAGDPEAQTNVGEIFEKGLGTDPNYAAALIWYEKAAQQGYSRGQFNLGTMYEMGLGVEADKLTALNWYRKAWGMPEESIVYQSAAWEEHNRQKSALQERIVQKDGQIQLLQSQIDRLKSDLNAALNHKSVTAPSSPQDGESQTGIPDAEDDLTRPGTAISADDEETKSLRVQVAQLEQMIAGLSQERNDAIEEYDAIPVFREPQAVELSTGSIAENADKSVTEKTSFGQYYALIIGNSDYVHMEDLATPGRDVERIGNLLESRYGFSVKVLQDINDVSIMHAINDLNAELDEDDNLLIYYAGHGSRMQMGDVQAGYWLPVNADPPPRDTHWIANEAITRHLGRLQAKRVLLVADSCYAGLLSDAPDYLFFNDSNQRQASAEFLQYKMAKSSRLLISSGGDFPVLDNFGDGNSVFAKAFIDILENNTEVLTGPELFRQLKPIVEEQSGKAGYKQVPSFKTIKIAGNEAGDFFFVPQDA